MLALLALLTGCAPEPASIKFDGPDSVKVHTLDEVAVAKATVLDKDNKAIEPQPTNLTWTVTPATVASLKGTKVAPAGSGEATVQAAVGEVKASYKFVVALPDAIEIAGADGYTIDSAWPADAATVTLVATVKAGADEVKGQTVTWSTSDETVATVDDKGVVTKVAADKTVAITAKSGDKLEKSVNVNTGSAAMATAPTP